MAVKFCFEQHFSHGATIKFGSLDIGACFFYIAQRKTLTYIKHFSGTLVLKLMID